MKYNTIILNVYGEHFLKVHLLKMNIWLVASKKIKHGWNVQNKTCWLWIWNICLDISDNLENLCTKNVLKLLKIWWHLNLVMALCQDLINSDVCRWWVPVHFHGGGFATKIQTRTKREHKNRNKACKLNCGFHWKQRGELLLCTSSSDSLLEKRTEKNVISKQQIKLEIHWKEKKCLSNGTCSGNIFNTLILGGQLTQNNMKMGKKWGQLT